MAQVFEVTVDRDRLTLDSDGLGEARFRVTNTGSEALTVRCRVVAGAGAEDFLQPLERPERHLEPEAAAEVTVKAQVPAGAAPGSYGFRLDAVSAHNPDEDFAEGPSVAFEVTPPEEPRPRGLDWGPIVLSAGLAALAALAVFLAVTGPLLIFTLPLAVALSVLVVRWMVGERRGLHGLLAAVLTVVIVFALLWLANAVDLF